MLESNIKLAIENIKTLFSVKITNLLHKQTFFGAKILAIKLDTLKNVH